MSRPRRPGVHFVWSELERSTAAKRLGVKMRVPDEHAPAVVALCAAILDPIRVALGRPVRITGGYRTPATNAAIGGSKTSQHMVGEAADIKGEAIGAEDLARLIVSLDLPFDQVIWYDPERGGHVHVSHTTTRANRGQMLHAVAGGGYVPWAP